MGRELEESSYLLLRTDFLVPYIGSIIFLLFLSIVGQLWSGFYQRASRVLKWYWPVIIGFRRGAEAS